MTHNLIIMGFCADAYLKRCTYFSVFFYCQPLHCLRHVEKEVLTQNPIIISLNYSLSTIDSRFRLAHIAYTTYPARTCHKALPVHGSRRNYHMITCAHQVTCIRQLRNRVVMQTSLLRLYGCLGDRQGIYLDWDAFSVVIKGILVYFLAELHAHVSVRMMAGHVLNT